MHLTEDAIDQHQRQRYVPLCIEFIARPMFAENLICPLDKKKCGNELSKRFERKLDCIQEHAVDSVVWTKKEDETLYGLPPFTYIGLKRIDWQPWP